MEQEKVIAEHGFVGNGKLEDLRRDGQRRLAFLQSHFVYLIRSGIISHHHKRTRTVRRYIGNPLFRGKLENLFKILSAQGVSSEEYVEVLWGIQKSAACLERQCREHGEDELANRLASIRKETELIATKRAENNSSTPTQ